MPTYSHSKLSSFENCRLQYKYNYIDGIKREGNSIEAFMGNRFHDTMERLYLERAFKEFTVEDLKVIFNEFWDKNWSDQVFVVRNDRTAEDYRKIGLEAIEKYHARYAPFDDAQVLGIERRLMIDLDGTGTYKVQGYLDRIMERGDGFYEIHDYKTAGTLPFQDKLDADRQLGLYEIAVRQAWQDVKEVDLVWHYVVFDKEMRSRRTPEQLEELKRSTIALIDEVETCEDFPPTESGLCPYCAYRDRCPLFAHKFQTDLLPSNEYAEEDGVALVDRLSKLDIKKRELKADLLGVDEEINAVKVAAIEYAQKEGVDRLYGKSRELTIRESIKVDYPSSSDESRDLFEDYLKSEGLWEQMLSFGAGSFKKYAKSNWCPDLVPAPFKDMVSFETIKRASLRKRKDVDDEDEVI